MNLLRDLQELTDEVRDAVATDATTLSRYSYDFGRIAKRTPGGVAKPLNIAQLTELIAWAARKSLPLALRGAGHSQAGQTLVDSGVVVDMRALSHVGEVDVSARLVEVEAGATWAAVIARSLPVGLAPSVLTSEHETSIGGTLSVGGMGSTSFRYGPQVANVAYLDVVTGDGQVARCSLSENRELFDAVRAGLGQFGAIARAGVLLRPVKPRLRTFTFVYDSADAFVEDLGCLVRAGEGTHVLAHFTPVEGGDRTLLRLTVGVEYFEGAEPDGPASGKLHCKEALPIVDTQLFGENHIFYFRYAEWFGTSEDFVYPWVDHYFTWKRARDYLASVLAGRFSPLFKAGVNTIIPIAASDHVAPLLTRRAKSEPLLLVGLFPKLPVNLADLSELVLAYAQRVEDEFGASRYLYGFADSDRTDWAQVFRERWTWAQEMKRRFDPFGIFNPRLLRL